MRLNDIQVAGLRAMATQTDGVPDQSAALSPELQLAFTMGGIYAQAKLARELLQEAADREPEAHACDLTGAARR